MRVQVQVMPTARDSLVVAVTVKPQGPMQHQQLLRHCSPHRRCNATVPPELLSRWRQLQQLGDHDAALELQQPAVVLWDQISLVPAEDGTASWHGDCADGLISRALIERLRWCDCLDDLLLTLQQLQLESRLSGRWQGDSADDDGFQPGSDRAGQPALWPAPARPGSAS